VSSIVLDASAAIAMVLGEPGGGRVMAAILGQKTPVAISAVNWCEVLARLQRHSSIMDAQRLSAMMPGVEVVLFGAMEAEQTAALAKACSSLSLGDRACLSLAAARHASAWTTDKVWVRVTTGAKVELLR
jgi:ribonuclease VapC